MRPPFRFLALALVSLSALPATAQVHASESPAPKPAPSNEPLAQPADRSGQPSAAASPDASALGESRVFRYEDLPVRTAGNGTQSRNVTHGTLRNGESVNLHESMQPGAAAPVALHTIQHTEFIYVQQGTVTFEHIDATGKTLSEPAGAGSVIYVAEGTNHRIRNNGSSPASYFVIAIGGDAR